MSKVRIVFPPTSTELATRTVTAVLAAILEGFNGVSWSCLQVDPDAPVVIFIASRREGDDQLDLDPIRIAVKRELTVFVITDDERTVSPDDFGTVTGEERIYFFHTKLLTAEEGFFPFSQLTRALRRVLIGQDLKNLALGM